MRSLEEIRRMNRVAPLPLPPVSDQEDTDPTCMCCTLPAHYYNENIRICAQCMEDVAIGLREDDGPAAYDEYKADWKRIVDWRKEQGSK